MVGRIWRRRPWSIRALLYVSNGFLSALTIEKHVRTTNTTVAPTELRDDDREMNERIVSCYHIRNEYWPRFPCARSSRCSGQWMRLSFVIPSTRIIHYSRRSTNRRYLCDRSIDDGGRALWSSQQWILSHAEKSSSWSIWSIGSIHSGNLHYWIRMVPSLQDADTLLLLFSLNQLFIVVGTHFTGLPERSRLRTSRIWYKWGGINEMTWKTNVPHQGTYVGYVYVRTGYFMFHGTKRKQVRGQGEACAHVTTLKISKETIMACPQ